ncbi:MAG: non-canonical purine NTP pyrophosphatase [Bacteriovoracales bacterium]
MKFLLASTNSHKLKELTDLGLDLESAPKDLGIIESGLTFYENAKIKAQGYYDHFKKPTLADDSGIIVEALPNELGVSSARFGGGSLTDLEKNQLLLKKLEGIEDRKAYFVCVLCFYLNPNEIFFFEGRLNGSISKEIKGDKGFGYDPVFIPEEFVGSSEVLTLAMIPDYKSKNSHRVKALNLSIQFFSKRNCQN